MNKLKIVSDGTGRGTQVFAGNIELTGIYAIEIERMVPDCVVRATISFHPVELEMVAELIEANEEAE